VATDEVPVDVAELETMLYKIEAFVLAEPAPARRGGYFPIAEQNDLQTAIASRKTGTNDQFWNIGANADASSSRIQAKYIIATFDKRAWTKNAFQQKLLPFKRSSPKGTEEQADLLRERLSAKRKVDEFFELERRTRIKDEMRAEVEAQKKKDALGHGEPVGGPPAPVS